MFAPVFFFCSRNKIIQIKRIVHISIVPIRQGTCALKSHTPPLCSLFSNCSARLLSWTRSAFTFFKICSTFKSSSNVSNSSNNFLVVMISCSSQALALFLCPLTFSGEFKGNDGSALFKRSRLSIGCLNVHGNAVKDGFAKRKIHSFRGIKLMIGIASIQGT